MVWIWYVKQRVPFNVCKVFWNFDTIVEESFRITIWNANDSLYLSNRITFIRRLRVSAHLSLNYNE
jgi:hypothetical protein